MNKISKKIVALVTMAAFVLTLVPMAAFAASTDTTGYVVDANNNGTASQAAVTITLSDDDLAAVTNNANPGNVIVWAEDANGQVVKSTEGAEWTGQGVKYLEGTAFSNNKATVNFANLAAGTYKFYVTVNTNAKGYVKDFAAAKKAALPVQSAYVYGEADRDHSGYGVVENGAVVATATATTDKAFTTKFVVNDANDTGTTAKITDEVIVWAEENGQPTNFVKFNGTTLSSPKNGYSLGKGKVDNNTEVEVTFTKAGTYKLYAGLGNGVDAAKYKQLQGTTTVTVTDQDVAIDNMKVSAETSKGETANISFDSTNTGKLDLTDKDFAYNGIDKVTLTGYAYDENGKPVSGKEITVSTNKDTVVEFDKTTVTTDNYGKFTVSFTMSDKSNADVTLANAEANIDYTVRVIAAKTSAQNIDRTKTGGYVLAGTDSRFTTDIVNDNFVDAVQFAITDQKGDAVTGPIAASEYTIDIRSKAKDGSTESTLEAKDLALVWNEANGVYTLAYTGNGSAGNYKTDLIPGKYEVRVALASDDNATVTFNAAKFGKVEDMTVDMTAANYADGQQKPTDGTHAITDEVTLGQKVTVEANYVDANGIKVPVTDNLQYGFDGKAVREINANDAVFYTAYDTPANESLLGTVIHVKVYNQANKQLVEKDLTVVDSYNSYSLEFDPAKGPINEDNDVTVKVVDKDGNVAKVNGTVSAYVADQGDADAKVSVDTTNATVKNGKATISVYGDRETTADIVVVVKAGSAIYAGTLEYTFGTEDPLANRTVVMTIGSSDYVVNNKIVTGDAAPFVDSNWRTMVPLRALAESFDAEVNWDNDARTVTINYDANTQIVMTIGESTYTVNGEEQTMDTAPVIQGDRTYVPIRFAAQGMGFSVTPLYDSNNLTASVVFQK